MVLLYTIWELVNKHNLEGPPGNALILDPLAVQHLNNQLYMTRQNVYQALLNVPFNVTQDSTVSLFLTLNQQWECGRHHK